MKKIIFPALVLFVASVIWSFSGNPEEKLLPATASLGIGDKAPMADVKMKDISGASKSLNDLKEENGLLVIFSCNTCPFVIEWEKTYPGLATKAKATNTGMVLVNANEAKRDNDDSMENMKKHAKEAGYTSSYVMDENNKLADAFGARTTPHVYLFDKDMKLVYRGLIDDRYSNREKKVSHTYLNDALTNLAAGKAIDPASTPEKGCSIKRMKS